jgi:uncharacterized membrane protein YphA (DoxX/SURF4 family)
MGGNPEDEPPAGKPQTQLEAAANQQANMKALFFFIIRVAIALLFIYAGVVKAADPGHFIAQIEAFHLVPYMTAYIMAHLLPMMEIVCGILLLTMRYTCAASLILILLTALFIGVLTTLKAAGSSVADCGCFGAWSIVEGYTSHVVMNFSIIVLLSVHAIRSAKLQHLMEKD